MEYGNIKPFIIGIVFCSLGAFLSFEMLDSTSWTTFSSSSEEESIELDADVFYDTEMEIGLHEITFKQDTKFCGDTTQEFEECELFQTLENYTILEQIENNSIDCIKTQEADEIDLCEMESAGSMGHSIILGGLGVLAFTFILASIGVMGYIPGRVLRLLGSLAAIVIFVGPIAWFVMFPDLNNGLEPSEQNWVLSHAFYLTLVSAPVILVGGLIFGNMEAFAFEEDDDWDDDDHYQAEDEYAELTTSITQPDYTEPEQPDLVDVNWQGVWGDDGYEWIEHPEGSEIWYWRDQDTGQWVRH
jgi:hypothetical protein